MSEAIDLVSDAALSALVDGELSSEEERALRERIAGDPALALRLARFEALNRALRADVEPGVSQSLSSGLAERIAADRARTDRARTDRRETREFDDGPPVFPDEAAHDTSNGARVVALPAGRNARRIALSLAAAAAAALLLYAVVSGPGTGGAGSESVGPQTDGPLLAEEERMLAPAREPRAANPATGSDERGSQLAQSPPEARDPAMIESDRGALERGAVDPGAPGSRERALAPRPADLAASDPAPSSADLPTPRAAERKLAAEAQTRAVEASNEAGASAEGELELYALALDDEVVDPDFDVIDNLELLELLAALEEEASQG